MEGRPERIADYFVVVGVGKKKITKFKQFEEEVNFPEKSALLEPVTDIAILYSKHEQEQLPKDYRIIESTPRGHSADVGSIFPSRTIYICYKKGRDKPPITDLGVFHSNQNQSPPAGYETLVFSIGGRTADLNRSSHWSHSYLSFKRGLIQGHNNAITDLCMIASSKGEEPPSCYKVLWSLDLGKGLVGHTLHLCYRTCQIRPPNIAFTPELLSRYPLNNHHEFALPDSVPLFCLPFGVSIEHWERHTPFPYPTFSTFALTNTQGQPMYGAVVVFYESVGEHACVKEMKRELNVHDEEPLHMNKCICLLSHWPFFSSFKAFLSALYRLSISHNIPLPLERYVGNLMLEVPFPSLVRPRILMHIGSENIIFSLPVQTPLPPSVLTHWSLLTSLDPDNCFTLLTLAMLEQKIVLHSSRPALLTCMGEALRSILFPFSWQCTYIPLCPLAFSSYMQAPVPFIIGIDSQYFDVFEEPSGVVVVDLNTNTIIMSKEVQELLSSHPPPSKASRALKQALQRLIPRVAGLDSGLDLAVEVSPIDYQHTHKHDMEVLDVEIREVFLRFFSTIIGHYRKSLTPLLSAPSKRSYEASHLFDQKNFLKNCHSSEWPFFHLFFDTQIFNAFIEQRSFAHAENTSFVFFDECTEKVKQQPNCKLVDAAASISRRSDLPTVVSPRADDSGLPEGKSYNYTVFPTVLDHSLFNHCPPSSSRPTRLKVSRLSASSTSLGSISPTVARRTNAEKIKDKELMVKAFKSDVLWSKCLLSHVCSLWYMLLPSHLSTHWNKMGLLAQAMELLEDMKLNKILPNDEVCYRILMEQCVRLRRPALAVRVYHEMIKAGIQPNAVTYGFYNKTVMEGPWPNHKRKWKILLIVISVCFFLKNLQQNDKKSSERPQLGKLFGEADFSRIAQSNSGDTRSISALDVGLDEKVEEEADMEEDGGGCGVQDYHSLRRRRRTVYKLTNSSGSSGSCGCGDYVVCGDSSYVAHKSPRWADGCVAVADRINSSIWSNFLLSATQSSSRIGTRTEPPSLSDTAPGLNIELSSCSQCPSCLKLVYDEQIMSGWTEDDGNYKTSCPFCSKQMVASLTIITKQTLPLSSPIDPSPIKSDPTSPSSSGHEVSSSSMSGVKDRDIFAGYSEENWLDNSLNAGLIEKCTDSSNRSMKVDKGVANPILKSHGVPTHYEKIDSTGTRGDVDVAIARVDSQSSCRTDSLCKWNQDTNNLRSNSTSSEADSRSGLEPVPEARHCSASHNLLKSPESSNMLVPNAATSQCMLEPNATTSLGQQLIQESDGKDSNLSGHVTKNFRHVTGNDHFINSDVIQSQNMGKSALPEIKVEKVSPRRRNRPSVGNGEGVNKTDLGDMFVRMKALGHRRSFSAPIKKPHCPNVCLAEGMRISQFRSSEEETHMKAPPQMPGFKTEVCSPLQIPYLSPVVLRKEVESILFLDGPKFLEREELVRERPIIYWNLVWYFSRLHLPTYLPLLSLWDFQHKNKQQLVKHSVHMKVELLWDRRFSGVRDPLYLVWLGKVLGKREVWLQAKPEIKGRDSESQLQSLVARIQCGEWTSILSSLLIDRHKDGVSSEEECLSRSIYRETLFLKLAVSRHVNLDHFDREFRQRLQHLPKELSAKLHPQDYPPTSRAVHCRQDFGLLQVKSAT